MHPHSAVYSRIAEMFLQQNNHLVYNDDLESTKVINSIISFYFSHLFFLKRSWALMLTRRMERERISCEQPFNSRGRPRKPNDDEEMKQTQLRTLQDTGSLPQHKRT